jgi:alpha-glucosidase
VFPLTEGFDSQAEACAGEVYTDDGHTLNFRNGEFARIHFSCSEAPNGTVNVQISKQEGTWKPWWREYRVEVVGFTPKTSEAIMNNQRLTMSQVEGRWGVVIPAVASGSSIQLK